LLADLARNAEAGAIALPLRTKLPARAFAPYRTSRSEAVVAASLADPFEAAQARPGTAAKDKGGRAQGSRPRDKTEMRDDESWAKLVAGLLFQTRRGRSA
jgi:hypothetical protein